MAAFDSNAFSKAAFSNLAFSMSGGNPVNTLFPTVKRCAPINNIVARAVCMGGTIEADLVLSDKVGLATKFGDGD